MNKDKEAKKEFEIAIKYHENKQIELAKLHYNNVLKINTSHIGALNNLGIIYIFKKKYDDALKVYEKIINLNKDYHSSYNSIGLIYKSKNDYKQAEIYFLKAIKINSNYFEAYNNLGLFYKDFNDHYKAIRYLEKATKLKPNYYKCFNDLGVVFFECGDYKKAIISYEKALSLNPNYSNTLCNIGLAYEKIGKTNEALKNYQKIPKNDLNYKMAQYNLGLLLLNDNQHNEAAKIFEQLDHKKSKSYLLKSYYKLNDKVNFIRVLDEEIKKNNTNAIIGSLVGLSKINFNINKKNLFCEKPLEYIYKSNLLNTSNFSEIFKNTCDEVLNENNFKDRSQPLLINGIQSAGNFFYKKNKNIQKIKEIIFNKIDEYYENFNNNKDGLIKNWPKQFHIYGWLVSMKNGGMIKPHIHDHGWLSGSIYINIPSDLDNNDGDLVLSLNEKKENLPNENTKIIKVQTGSLCLFPSSLFHYTFPFKSNEDRIVLAFDVI